MSLRKESGVKIWEFYGLIAVFCVATAAVEFCTNETESGSSIDLEIQNKYNEVLSQCQCTVGSTDGEQTIVMFKYEHCDSTSDDSSHHTVYVTSNSVKNPVKCAGASEIKNNGTDLLLTSSFSTTTTPKQNTTVKISSSTSNINLTMNCYGPQESNSSNTTADFQPTPNSTSYNTNDINKQTMTEPFTTKQTSSSISERPTTSVSKTTEEQLDGGLIGGIIGGLVLVILLIIIIIFVMKHHKKKSRSRHYSRTSFRKCSNSDYTDIQPNTGDQSRGGNSSQDQTVVVENKPYQSSDNVIGHQPGKNQNGDAQAEVEIIPNDLYISSDDVIDRDRKFKFGPLGDEYTVVTRDTP